MFGFGKNYEVWKIHENDFPRSRSIQEKIKFILNYGILAPSTLNTQPWLCKIKGNKVQIFADWSKQLTQADPSSKQLFVSIGSFIFNIKSAAAYFGFKTSVNYTQSKNRSSPVAQISFKTSGSVEKGLKDLFPAIKKRFSARTVLEKTPITDDILKKIEGFNNSPDHQIFILKEQKIKKQISNLIYDSEKEILGKKKIAVEFSKWLRINWTGSYDGIPGFNLGFSNIQSLFIPYIMRLVGPPEYAFLKNRTLAIKSFCHIVITSSHENKTSWMKIGEIYERILLYTTNNGIRSSTMISLTESTSVRKKLMGIIEAKSNPQIFIRLGYKKGLNKVLSPRKPLNHIII